jgi:uncharacterized membrane protein
LLKFFGVIAGAAIGGVLGEGFGALVGAVLAWLVMASHRQALDIAALRSELRELAMRHVESGAAGTAPVRPSAQAAAPGQSPGAEQGQPQRQSPGQLPMQAPEPQRPEAASASETVTPALPARATPAAASRAAAQPEPAPETEWGEEPHDTEVGSLWGDVPTAAQPMARSAAKPGGFDPFGAVKQWLFGGNTIVKLGVAILFIGLAFLAKLAAEHVHVPIELRLAGIAGVAVVLLVLGWRLRDKRAAYAQVLQGGAIAVLYLTLFVAFRFYGVLGVGPVFACMVVVAALAAALAVLQDARALAVIGALGGFATPLLVSTGAGNHVALFGYYLVLDLGIAAVAWHKNWRLLNLIGFFATFLVGTAWGVLKYQSDHYASTQAFLIAYFLVFMAILLMPVRRALGDAAAVDLGGEGSGAGRAEALPQRSDVWVNGSLLFGLPTIAFVLQHSLVRHMEYGTALSALVLALFYVLLAMWMRKRAVLAVTFEASLGVATVFLTLVIPFALDARSTAGAWALEGAGLVWLGLRQQRRAPRLFGYALLFLAGLAMFHAFERHGIPNTFFNGMLFNGLMAAAASLAAACFVKRFGGFTPVDVSVDTGSPARHEAVAEPLLIAWGTLWLLATAASQIDKFTPPGFELTAWLASLSAIAVAYSFASQRLDWPRIAWPVVAHAPLLAVMVAASAATQDSPVQYGGWWAWPLALAAHGFVLWRAAPRWTPPTGHAVHTLGLLVLAALGALLGRAVTRDWGDAESAWAWLGWLVVPAALLMLLPRPGLTLRWPVRDASAAYQTHGAAIIAAGLVLWSLLANIASNGAAAPLPHVPLLNPLDLGIGIALLGAWLWMRSAPAQGLLARQPDLAMQVTAAAGFVWLNAILIRGFHHYGGVPYRFKAWVDTLAVQTGISLLWSATALVLMWLAARRGLRTPWLVGAVLLGAVVLKLVLVDLSATGTVTRIVSFIGVGVLMLLIGYVAPMPAGDAEREPGHG